MNIFVWGWHSDSQAKAIETLCSENDFQIVHWLRNGENREIDRLIHRPFEVDAKDFSLSHDLVSKIEGARIKFMEMYSRVTIGNGMNYNDLNHIFWIYVKYFEHLFEESQPDILLMGSPPHFGADYIMYQLARLRGIKTKVVLQTLFSNRFLCVDAVNDFGSISVEPRDQDQRYKLEDYRNKTQFYMKTAKRYNKSCTLSFIGNVIRGPRRFKPMSFEAALGRYKDCLFFKKHVWKMMVKEPDLKRKYVYFPLQLQPEMTTSMLGGDIYSDQILALEILHSMLPDDWKIYVKENPKQTPSQRSFWFYRRLQAFKKVKYLDLSINSQQLIDSARFVAVVTGTAGWEALLSNKSVLSFGYAWFNSLPGVFPIDKDPDLSELVDFKHDPELLEESFNALMATAFSGVVDNSYKVIVDGYSDEENIRLLVQSLKGILQ